MPFMCFTKFAELIYSAIHFWCMESLSANIQQTGIIIIIKSERHDNVIV